MILKQEENIIIRTMETKDEKEIYGLFSKESFGYLPMARENPAFHCEKLIEMEKIINKEILDKEYVILEKNNEIIAYIEVYQDDKDRIILNNIITKKQHRKKGYATYLLQFLVDYANQNNLKIRISANNIQQSLLMTELTRNLSFKCANYEKIPTNNGPFSFATLFTYNPKEVQLKNISSFLDYDTQQKINEEELEKHLKDYRKTLKFLKDNGF